MSLLDGRQLWNPRKQAQAKLCAHLRAYHEMITVEPAQGLFNHKCFFNAVEYAKTHYAGIEVVEVVYIEDGEPVLHYINFDSTTGKYLETTLGHRAKHLEYYFLRRINEKDFPWIHSEFSRALDAWTKQFTSWIGRVFFDIERIL